MRRNRADRVVTESGAKSLPAGARTYLAADNRPLRWAADWRRRRVDQADTANRRSSSGVRVTASQHVRTGGGIDEVDLCGKQRVDLEVVEAGKAPANRGQSLIVLRTDEVG